MVTAWKLIKRAAKLLLVAQQGHGRHAGHGVESQRGIKIPAPQHHVPVGRQGLQHAVLLVLEIQAKYRIVLGDGAGLTALDDLIP